MAKLPFIVEPRLKPITEVLGTEASGKIEIERKGFLSTAEKSFMQVQAQTDDTTQRMVALTRKVGTEYKIDMQEAYNKLSEAMQGNMEGICGEISKKYKEEIEEVLNYISSMQERTILMQALCMILYRVDSSFDTQSIMDVHPDLIEALATLYDDEEARSTTRLAEVMEIDEENADASAIDALEKK